MRWKGWHREGAAIRAVTGHHLVTTHGIHGAEGRHTLVLLHVGRLLHHAVAVRVRVGACVAHGRGAVGKTVLLLVLLLAVGLGNQLR